MKDQRPRRKRPAPTAAADKGLAALTAAMAARERGSVAAPPQMIDLGLQDGEDRAAAIARVTMGGLIHNAIVAYSFSHGQFPDLNVNECVAALRTQVQAVQAGDLAQADTLLTGQAAALNAIFAEFSSLAYRNIGNLDAAERFLRLALRAQNQARATLETLATIKNPPTVFARQANIANGPQQVNNGPVVTSEAPARAGEIGSRPIELLEGHAERVELGTTKTAGAGDQRLAPVGAVNRTENH